MALRVWIGANENENPVGYMGVGGPYLLSRDAIDVPVPYRLGAYRGEVRSRIRLAKPLRPDVVAAQDWRQETSLHRICAECIDHRADKVSAHKRNPRGVGRETLLLKDIDRKSTRLNSSHANISYAVFCLKKKKNE